MFVFINNVSRLFFGGFWYIKLESIYITKTNQNFKMIVTILSYFHSIISGAFNFEEISSQITDKHVSLLNGLFSYNLDSKKSNHEIEYDPYILSTFNSFTQSNKDMIINYYNLDKENKSIVDLIMYQIEENDDYKHLPNDSSFTNLFKPQLLNIFTKTKSITLITNDEFDIFGNQRSISMVALLSIINNTTLQKVLILSFGSNESIQSWQTYLWSQSWSNLIHLYSASKYKVQLKYGLGRDQKYHGFVINRE